MTLSTYHQKHADRPEVEIAPRIAAKKAELVHVLDVLGNSFKPPVRIAVLGCASKQIAFGHIQIFGELFGASVDVITFDITTEHLLGVPNVIKHDCTLPLPGAPFDITYGHVLLKFMPPEKQWQLLLNSYNALKPGGIAIHIMDKNGKVRPTVMMQEGTVDVPLDEHIVKLTQAGIGYKIIDIKVGPNQQGNGTCLVLIK